jgi:hypothetical protein
MKINKKMVIFGLLVAAAIVLVGVLVNATLMPSKDVEVNDLRQGDETFKNIDVKFFTEKQTYAKGENISGNLTLINGRDETIYLAGQPPFTVDILSKSTLERICPPNDFAAILILLHIPVSSHSTYNLISYPVSYFYFVDQKSSIPPGKYIVRISFSVSLILDGDVDNIDTYSGTAETTVTIM